MSCIINVTKHSISLSLPEPLTSLLRSKHNLSEGQTLIELPITTDEPSASVPEYRKRFLNALVYSFHVAKDANKPVRVNMTTLEAVYEVPFIFRDGESENDLQSRIENTATTFLYSLFPPTHYRRLYNSEEKKDH